MAKDKTYNALKIADIIVISEDPLLIETKNAADEWLSHLKTQLEKRKDAKNKVDKAQKALDAYKV